MNRIMLCLILSLCACNYQQHQKDVVQEQATPVQNDMKLEKEESSSSTIIPYDSIKEYDQRIFKLNQDDLTKLKQNEAELLLFVERLKSNPDLVLEKWSLPPEVLTPSAVTIDSMIGYNDGYKKITDRQIILSVLDYFLHHYQNAKFISLNYSFRDFQETRTVFRFCDKQNCLMVSIPDGYSKQIQPDSFSMAIQYQNGKVVFLATKSIKPGFLDFLIKIGVVNYE